MKWDPPFNQVNTKIYIFRFKLEEKHGLYACVQQNLNFKQVFFFFLQLVRVPQ